MDSLIIRRPDDWHLHLRDGAMMRHVVNYSAEQFGRALIMPNLRPPITRVDQALDYQARILEALPASSSFKPLMSLYLTDTTPVSQVIAAAENPFILGFKLYPYGATTNAEEGVTDIEKIYGLLETMERHDLVLQIHGEVTDPDIDIFDREKIFIERELIPLTERFPALRMVLEHVTTREGVDFVRSSPDTIAATVTAHHLLYNRNHLLAGGVHPHYYCLPVLKREIHRQALLQAVTSGNPKFFLGTDSAPHPRGSKESACGCAGCFTAPAALAMYAQAFESQGALSKLEDFASSFGADFYRLPRNQALITLQRKSWKLPDVLLYDGAEIIPLNAGETIPWKL